MESVRGCMNSEGDGSPRLCFKARYEDKIIEHSRVKNACIAGFLFFKFTQTAETFRSTFFSGQLDRNLKDRPFAGRMLPRVLRLQEDATPH